MHQHGHGRRCKPGRFYPLCERSPSHLPRPLISPHRAGSVGPRSGTCCGRGRQTMVGVLSVGAEHRDLCLRIDVQRETGLRPEERATSALKSSRTRSWSSGLGRWLEDKRRPTALCSPRCFIRIRGDQQHFVRRDELRAAFIFTPLLHDMDCGKLKSVPYKARNFLRFSCVYYQLCNRRPTERWLEPLYS